MLCDLVMVSAVLYGNRISCADHRSVSIIMQKRCTFPWTPHIERFAMELAQDPEYPSDQYTIHLVRLQHVFERIDEVSISHPPGMQGRMPEMERQIYSFRQELEDFKGQLSFTRTNCRTLDPGLPRVLHLTPYSDNQHAIPHSGIVPDPSQSVRQIPPHVIIRLPLSDDV